MLKDKLISVLKEKGWMAIESLYFDNGLIVSVAGTAGRIGLCEGENVLVSLSCNDIMHTDLIAGTSVYYNYNELGHTDVLNMVDLDSLQRVNYALYSKSKQTDLYSKQSYPINLPNPTEANYETMATDLADMDLRLTRNNPYDPLNPGKVAERAMIKSLSIFPPLDDDHIDAAWWNLEYLQNIWYKNKFHFNKIVQDYLNITEEVL